MAETVFSCPCGMILKVYGDDQAGSRIECPSCKSSVVVPGAGARPKTAPLPVAAGDDPHAAAPESGSSLGLLLLCLAIVTVVTIGLVKFLLLPALAEPGKEAGTIVAARKEPDEDEVKSARTTARTSIAPAPSKRPRKFVVPKEPDSEALPVYPADAKIASAAPVKPPVAPVVPPAPPPDVPPAKSAPPARDVSPAPPKPTIPPEEAKPKTNVKTPLISVPDETFAHITDERARKDLVLALQNLNQNDAEATRKAEMFLRHAEDSANGNPKVLAEVKKLRARTTPDETFAHITDARARNDLIFALKNINQNDADSARKAEMFLRHAEDGAYGDRNVLAAIKKLRARIAELQKAKR